MDIYCNPTNPVEYLASLGIFTIASRCDRLIEGRWTDQGFELQSSTLSEAELAGLIRPVLTDITHWTFVSADAAAYRVNVDFGSFSISLDWWYDSVNDLATERVFENSSWKLFAGQQTVLGITQKLIASVAKSLPAQPSLTDLVRYRQKVNGRFGFDPLASQSALDAGYSADNLGLPVPTSTAAELLSLFAIQVFFPPRCGAHARGWVGSAEAKSGFSYCLWEEFLPLTLARIAAARSRERLFSQRKNRDKYKNLSPATQY